MLDISAIILTKDEEIHIERCLDRISDFVKKVYIIDSGSTDKTLEIASKYSNVEILYNKWVNYATQFNWALNNCPISTEWVLRLDADEYLTEELKTELEEKLPSLENKYTGIVFYLQRVFKGRIMKHGGESNVQMTRMFRYGKAITEVRQMDEHIQLLEGELIYFKNAFADDNINDLSWWTYKHIGYAIREAADLLDIEFGLTTIAENDSNKEIVKQAKQLRMLKHKYVRMPLFWRSFAYFCSRYFLRLGFLDGKEGFMWHFFQAWWYRSFVDAKVLEIKRACGNDKEKIRMYLMDKYKIRL